VLHRNAEYIAGGDYIYPKAERVFYHDRPYSQRFGNRNAVEQPHYIAYSPFGDFSGGAHRQDRAVGKGGSNRGGKASDGVPRLGFRKGFSPLAPVSRYPDRAACFFYP
jgi:hypothetical protein